MTEKPFMPFRDAAGIFAAFLIVAAFVASGPIETFLTATTGVQIALPEWWRVAMVSLASAAFGYLIGKRMTSFKTGFDRPLCKSCPIREQIAQADSGQ